MNTPHPPQTQPDAAAGDGLDIIVAELAGNSYKLGKHNPPDSDVRLMHLENKAKAALKAWALAKSLAALPERQYVDDKIVDTSDSISPLMLEQVHKNTGFNQAIDTAAANLKRQLGVEG